MLAREHPGNDQASLSTAVSPTSKPSFNMVNGPTYPERPSSEEE